MSLVLLVRHGQASWGAADYDVLSDLGRRQSAALGTSLAGRGVTPDLVVRGSLRRHRETTDAADEAAGWGNGVVEDAGWDEFDHLGTLDGSVLFDHRDHEPYDERVRRFHATIERWSSGEHDPEYRESFPAFQARVLGALDRTFERLGEKGTAVVFTSGGPVSWVAATLVDGGVPAWRRLSRVVVNSSVTKVHSGRWGTNLVSFNDHAHLEADRDLLSYR
ncbi:MAG: histidine phosphatase family protein [Nocardioidaceae bacterium]|nr:histidine phosphatase family protein [Nocardioidaceae bacterium]